VQVFSSVARSQKDKKTFTSATKIRRARRSFAALLPFAAKVLRADGWMDQTSVFWEEWGQALFSNDEK
jgi:hypothetical protein